MDEFHAALMNMQVFEDRSMQQYKEACEQLDRLTKRTPLQTSMA